MEDFNMNVIPAAQGLFFKKTKSNKTLKAAIAEEVERRFVVPEFYRPPVLEIYDEEGRAILSIERGDS